MINSLEKSTKYVLYSLTIAKQNELKLYENKIIELRKKIDRNPDSTIIGHKYFLTKMRYDQLKKTIHELWELDQELLFKKRMTEINTLEVS